MAVTVVVRSAEGDGERELALSFDTPRVVIGRSDGCDVRLPDPSVSLRHASIRQKGGAYVLVDEGSTNGTFLDKVRLPPQTPRVIVSGELVRIGRVWLELRLEPAAKSASAAAVKELALELVVRGLREQGEAAEPRLEVVEGPGLGASLALAETDREYVIGRAKQVDLVIDDERVARRHASVTLRGDTVKIADFNTATGTLLDGATVPASAVTWKPGQEITVGASVLSLAYPAIQALAEIERAPDEKMREAEAPEPPARTAEPAASTPTPPPPGALDLTPDPGPIVPADRDRGGWGFTDAVVVMLAMGVLALSAAGAWWLFH